MKTTIKTLLMWLAIAMPVMANDIYVTQSGDNLDLDITQDGQNNVAGNSTTAMSLTGSTMTFSISQVGDSNVIEAIINGSTYTGNINLTGGSNTVDLDCAANNCDTVSMSIDVTGSSADITVDLGSTADTSDYTGTIDITNTALGSSLGNTSNYTQSGDGDINGHSLTHSHTGEGATIDISQSGVYDNKLVLTTSGDNADIDITQSD